MLNLINDEKTCRSRNKLNKNLENRLILLTFGNSKVTDRNTVMIKLIKNADKVGKAVYKRIINVK
ncbi:MAG: hypothetical protein IPK35_19180 [Saprospiraceae bacterium]|nr:hypothetical protein [Saprospiraceae bacterium]